MPDGAGGFGDALMGMVGGGAPAGPPGGAPPPVGAQGPGGPPGGAPPGGAPQQQADPMQRLQAALTLLTLTLSEMGLTETASKAVNVVVKSVEKLMKQTPQGRQGAVMQGGVPPSPPPGVGGLPGANVI